MQFKITHGEASPTGVVAALVNDNVDALSTNEVGGIVKFAGVDSASLKAAAYTELAKMSSEATTTKNGVVRVLIKNTIGFTPKVIDDSGTLVTSGNKAQEVSIHTVVTLPKAFAAALRDGRVSISADAARTYTALIQRHLGVGPFWLAETTKVNESSGSSLIESKSPVYWSQLDHSGAVRLESRFRLPEDHPVIRALSGLRPRSASAPVDACVGLAVAQING